MANWGQHKYGDGVPVPLKADRCPNQRTPGYKTHVCKLHTGHAGKHRCICGKGWE